MTPMTPNKLDRLYLTITVVAFPIVLAVLHIVPALQGQAPLPARSDAVAQAQTPSPVQNQRPEQGKTAHDNSGDYSASGARPSSPVFNTQPKARKNTGIDYFRDPVNSDRPNQNPDEIMQALAAGKQGVMDAQRRLLEGRYNLQPRLDPAAKMSRGKPLVVGPRFMRSKKA